MTPLKIGLCCISLNTTKKFQNMTFKQFSNLPRNQAIHTLSKRIMNNLITTNTIIQYCANNNLAYRMSSNIFPLITYKQTNLTLQELPNYTKIEKMFNIIKNTINTTKVRISTHPSEYNVLASNNQQAINNTINELNFYSKFMDQIGCPNNHNSPINLHIRNKDNNTINKFLTSFNQLHTNCQKRLVIENDDKQAGWSITELLNQFYPKTNIPITYDSHHHRINNTEQLSPENAVKYCKQTWNNIQPLFHFSNGKNHPLDRAHSNNVYELHTELLNQNLCVDFEFKNKDQAIQKFLTDFLTTTKTNDTI